MTGREDRLLSEDPATALAAVVALRRQADRLERVAVACAIEERWTWTQIAEALGITRQAAHKRLAPPRRSRRTSSKDQP